MVLGFNVRYTQRFYLISFRFGVFGRSPTALDAIMFAYLHRALNTPDKRISSNISSRENLVLWERKVRAIVDNAVSQSH